MQMSFIKSPKNFPLIFLGCQKTHFEPKFRPNFGPIIAPMIGPILPPFIPQLDPFKDHAGGPGINIESAYFDKGNFEWSRLLSLAFGTLYGPNLGPF